MSKQALEAAINPPAQETSTPAVEDENKAEQGQEAAPEEAKTEDAKPEADKAAEPSEADKVRQAMQKRIDRQTAASKALQERISKLTQEMEKLAASAPKPDDAPKQDDFDDYDQYEAARIEYEAKKKADEILKGEREKELKLAQERQTAELRKVFGEKEKAFRSTTPDYDRVAGEAADTLELLAQTGVNIAPLRDVVMQFDNPPEMIYHLGKDTSLIEELVGMPPLKIMLELVKLEAVFQGAAKAEPQRAPEPIKPVSGKGGVKPIAERSGKDILDWAKNK